MFMQQIEQKDYKHLVLNRGGAFRQCNEISFRVFTTGFVQPRQNILELCVFNLCLYQVVQYMLY